MEPNPLLVTPAREQLAHATRHLIDVVLTSEFLDEEVLGNAASQLDAILQDLVGAIPPTRERRRSRVEQTHEDYMVRSPIFGPISPIAPPLTREWDGTELTFRGMFPTACEGPPGYVHGGWIALAFDEALGFASVASGHPGMTGKLTTKYRKPTPVLAEISIRAWVAELRGRVATLRCELIHEDEVTAEGEGLFIQIPEDLAREYFGDA